MGPSISLLKVLHEWFCVHAAHVWTSKDSFRKSVALPFRGVDPWELSSGCQAHNFTISISSQLDNFDSKISQILISIAQ